MTNRVMKSDMNKSLWTLKAAQVALAANKWLSRPR